MPGTIENTIKVLHMQQKGGKLDIDYKKIQKYIKTEKINLLKIKNFSV